MYNAAPGAGAFLSNARVDSAVVASFDPSVQASLPLPLARLYTRAFHAKSPRDRHDHAFHLLEASLKLVASALLARYRKQGHRSPDVDAALERLALPSLGHWRDIFVKSLSFLSQGPGSDPWARRIHEHLAEDGNEPLEEIRALMPVQGRCSGQGGKVRLLDLLDLLPAYRNAMSDAHGSIKADPAVYTRATPALIALAQRIHHGSALLGAGRLVYAEEVRVGNRGEQRVVWMDLQGLAALRRQTLDGEVSTESMLPGRLYLEVTPGDHLPLHPFLFYRPGEVLDEVFFLNRAKEGKGGIQFLSYSTGDFYVPDRDSVGKDLVADLREFLSWVTRRDVDSDGLEVLVEASRSDALSKGETLVAEDEPAGKVFEDFEILGELGRGGMAVVYRARQRSLGRIVSLKVLPAELGEDPVALARFKQEVRALSRCDHPNVVKVLSSGHIHATWYYAMEFIDGGDLALIGQALRRCREAGVRSLREGHFDRAVSSVGSHPKEVSRRAPVEVERLAPESVPDLQEGRDIAQRLAEVFRDVARGVQHIHDQGIVHRDLKPQNIMVTRHEHRPVIMDLGLAKVSGTSQSLTRDRASILGTLRYMPPEQLQRNLLEVDARADVYALGTVLYELACHRPMLDGDTEERLTTQILFEEPPPPRKVNPDVPADLATIITKATRKDPKDRFASASELAEDLNRYVHGEAILARPATLGYLLKLFVKRHPIPAALGSSALFIIFALLLGWVASLRTAWHREHEAGLEKEGLYLASQSQAALPWNPGRALLLAIEAARRHPGLQANNALLASLEALHERNTFVRRVSTAQFSPNGQRIVTASLDSTAHVWDVATGKELFTLVGHGDDVGSAFFSPDGQRIVTASLDGTARIWDAASGEELFASRGHEDGVASARFSPDGQRIVTASKDRTARIWDAASGKELFALRGHEDGVASAHFSSDGQRVVTASPDKTARIWDAGGKELFVLRGHEDGVTSAHFSPDGQRVVTASPDKTARVWDAASGKELFALRGHEDGVTSAHFSPDSQSVVTASRDKAARVWDVTSGKELFALTGHEDLVTSARFSPDGRKIVTASWDRTARVWDSMSRRELLTLRGHEDATSFAQFSPDGEMILTVSGDMTARIWDVTSGGDLLTLRGHEGAASFAQFSPDGETILTASGDKTARIWDVTSGRELFTLGGHEGEVYSAQFSPDGEKIFTASGDKTARIWDATSGKELFILRGHEDEVYSTQCSPDGQRIVTASWDGTARIWDVASGKELFTLRGHESGVSSAQFSPNAPRIVTTSWDRTARIWDATSGRDLFTLRGHENLVYSAQFSPDGKRIVTASRDRTARVWDVRSGKELVALRGHEGEVFSAQFSPDGKKIVTASRDRTAWIWDVTSGGVFFILRGHGAYVRSAQFSPDGRRIATASWDRTARIWDVTSGKELFTLRGHESRVSSAQFSPDGRRIVTASWDNTTRIWPLDLLSIAMKRKPRDFTPDEEDAFEIGSPEERWAHRQREWIRLTSPPESAVTRAGK